MKKIIILALILGTYSVLIAQISFTTNYAVMSSRGWEEIISVHLEEEQAIHLNSTAFRLGYAFQFKNLNVEFMPEAHFARFHQRFEENIGFNAHQFSNTVIGLDLVGHIYFLDIKSDAKLPAVQRKGSFLKKNLFLRTSVGVQHFDANYRPPSDGSTFFLFSTWNNAWVATAGLGLGLDIGLSDFLTVSPIVEFNFAKPEKNWFQQPDTLFVGTSSFFPTFPTASPPPNVDRQVITTQFGLRMKIAFW